MSMIKGKITKIATSLTVTSFMVFGTMVPVSAAEYQPILDNIEVIEDTQDDSSNSAAQFSYTEDGQKILTVTPKGNSTATPQANYRSHNRNFQNGASEITTPGAIETPVDY